MLGKNSGLYFVENQINKKEVIPAWVIPPFLLCKDNTFLSEIQIRIFWVDVWVEARCAKNCDILWWSNQRGEGVIFSVLPAKT